MSKTKTILSLIFNLLVFICTVCSIISYFFVEPNVLISNGFDSFKYFTTDSNVLAAIIGAVVAVYDILILAGKRDSLPKPVVILKFIAAACVTLTMTVTLLFLMPFYGTFVIAGPLFIVHVSSPALTLISFVFFETVHRIGIPKSFLALIPMLLYGAVYYVEVFLIGEANGGWKDFYAYNRDGNWLLSNILLVCGGIVVSILTAVLHDLVLKHAEKKRLGDKEKKQS